MQTGLISTLIVVVLCDVWGTFISVNLLGFVVWVCFVGVLLFCLGCWVIMVAYLCSSIKFLQFKFVYY